MPTDSQSAAAPVPKKRDPVISCLKGLGMVFIILIHLIDWSNIEWGRMGWEKWSKEILYVGPLWFIALSGTVVAIAYGRKPLWTATKRLWMRGIQLILIFYAYNIAKLFLFDFSTEPFYGLPEKSWATVVKILSFHTFTVPITIILSIGAFLLISPIFLWASKGGTDTKGEECTEGGKMTLFFLTVLSIIPVYLYEPGASQNPLVKFLFSDGYVLYPLLLWLPTFLIGFLWGKLGWQTVAWKALGIFAILAASSLLIDPPSSFALSANEFPIRPYYLWTSFLVLALVAQAFSWLTRRESKLIQKTIIFLAWLGDKSLFIYIGHWIVIDLTLWAFAPQWKAIWLTVGLFLVAYRLAGRR